MRPNLFLLLILQAHVEVSTAPLHSSRLNFSLMQTILLLFHWYLLSEYIYPGAIRKHSWKHSACLLMSFLDTLELWSELAWHSLCYCTKNSLFDCGFSLALQRNANMLYWRTQSRASTNLRILNLEDFHATALQYPWSAEALLFHYIIHGFANSPNNSLSCPDCPVKTNQPQPQWLLQTRDDFV